MKILLVHNYYRYRGGEDRYAETLKDTLTQHGHQVVQFSFDSREIKEYSIIRKLSIPRRFIRSREVEQSLETLLEKEKPDLAMIHNMFPLISLSTLQVLKKHGVPIIKRIENYRFLCLNGLFLRNNHGPCDLCKDGNFWPGIRYRCYQESFLNSVGMALPLMLSNWKKLLFSTVDYFLAPSQFVRETFIQVGFPGDRVKVLPNFLDFRPVERPEAAGDYAVFIGRLSGEKGLWTLLKAFEGLDHIPLKVLGDGPMEEDLKNYVRDKEMEHIQFLGFVDGEAKQEILSKARFLVFPSECYESFGYSIIESHACGVPVVAAAIGGSRELIIDGENGYSFEPGNAGDLKEKIQRLHSDESELQQMKEKSLKRVKELYTGEKGYRDLMNLFQSLQ